MLDPDQSKANCDLLKDRYITKEFTKYSKVPDVFKAMNGMSERKQQIATAPNIIFKMFFYFLLIRPVLLTLWILFTIISIITYSVYHGEYEYFLKLLVVSILTISLAFIGTKLTIL